MSTLIELKPKNSEHVEFIFHNPSFDWMKLETVYKLAAKAQVSFEMSYEDGPNQWYFIVSSPVKHERFTGKSHSFSIAVEAVIEHLTEIGGGD